MNLPDQSNLDTTHLQLHFDNMSECLVTDPCMFPETRCVVDCSKRRKKMKKIIVLLVLFSLLFTVSAQAEGQDDDTYHKLWGIEFDWTIEQISEYLNQEKGIILYSWSNTINSSYDIHHDRRQELTIYGVPYDLSVARYGREKLISLQLRGVKPENILEIQSKVFKGLFSKYGTPSVVYVELNSNGGLWDGYIGGPVYQDTIVLDNVNMIDFDIIEYAKTWIHHNNRTGVKFFVIISPNIMVDISINNVGDQCQTAIDVQVIFSSKKIDTNIVEKNESKNTTQYVDDGF